jgi:hypothetical protein
MGVFVFGIFFSEILEFVLDIHGSIGKLAIKELLFRCFY